MQMVNENQKMIDSLLEDLKIDKAELAETQAKFDTCDAAEVDGINSYAGVLRRRIRNKQQLIYSASTAC